VGFCELRRVVHPVRVFRNIEVLGSNLASESAYFTEVVHGFSQFQPCPTSEYYSSASESSGLCSIVG
jgi:hypothetical protein